MAGRRRSILALCLLTSCVFPTFSAFGDEAIDYTYDARGRLTKVVRSGAAHPATVRTCYTYDKADNRKNVTVDDAADCVAGGSDDGGPVTFSIANNGPVSEGNPSVFKITKTGTATGSLQVSYATANGSAIAPGDYTAKALTALTFTTTDLEKTVSVTTADDSTAESDESFTMTLSAPTGGAVVGTGSATGTINDNDSAGPCSGVTFSVSSNGPVTEGASSDFSIAKSGSSSSSCSVNYATANGSAVAPGDYTAKSTTTLTFTTAQSSQSVNVTTINDSAVESQETFAMNLSSPSGGAALGTATVTATINDNDSAAPCSGVSFKITSDGLVVEGGTETFTVSKAGTTSSSCDVYYATANGSALAGSDYVAKSSTKLTFTSAQSSKSVTVATVEDAIVESSETFSMSLSNPSGGATLGNPSSVTVTIGDDDTEEPPEQCYNEGGIPIPCDELVAPPAEEVE